jgi:hypothetical protein
MKVITFLLILAGILFSRSTGAIETKVVVRAKAKNTKFIEASMGNALVPILR